MYPLISEYIEAIKAAEDNFDQLKHLRPVLDDDGLPVMTSGNFAVVFKMKDEQTDKLYAVKCFTKEQEGRAEAYLLIAEELKDVDSPYLVSLHYLDKELFVDTEQTNETEFPVLLMDWVEGKTLDKYLRENLDDKYALELLAYRFSQLAQWLMPQPFAHGDLKPDNILVRKDGTLVLVDYDGMYVPAMKGQKAREFGSPDFRHPARTEDDFDEHIDDFALLILTLSILIACESPSSFSFPVLTNDDFHSLNTSQSLKHIFPSSNAAINKTVSAIVNCIIDNEMMLSLTIYDTIAKQIRWNYYIYAQNYYDLLEEQGIDHRTFYERFHRKGGFDENRKHYPVYLAKAVDDVDYEYPYAYNYNHSFYKGLLLNACDVYAYSYLGDSYEDFWIEMSLPSDTIVIGKEALSDCALVELIVVPNSVKYIGDKVFYNCENLRYIVFPESIEGFGTEIFNLKDSYINSKTGDTDTRCYGKGAHSLVNIIVPDGTKDYYANLLPDYRHLIVDFSELVNSKDTSIKSLLASIAKKKEVENRKLSTKVTDEDLANAWIDEFGVKYSADKIRLLEANTRIQKCSILKGTKIICNNAFSLCTSLNSIKVPNGVVQIGKSAFSGCWGLKILTISDSVTFIGEKAFRECHNLISAAIPKSVKFIGYEAFAYCENLSNVDLPNSISSIEKGCFFECERLTSIIIPNNVKSIGDWAFYGCVRLKNIIVPNNVTHIGNRAFGDCWSLTSVMIPNSVTSIGEEAFKGCSNLTSVSMPKSIKSISKEAFAQCYRLTTMIIPENVVFVGDHAFWGCSNLTSVIIPDSVTAIGDYAFCQCNTLKKIVIQNTVTGIGKYVFQDCTSVEQIIIPMGTRCYFENMLPEYKFKLVEQ